jgi:hypothetical protein
MLSTWIHRLATAGSPRPPNERIVSRAHQEEKSVLAGVEGALDHNPLDEPREVRLWALYRWGKEFHEAPLVIWSRGGEQRGRGKG